MVGAYNPWCSCYESYRSPPNTVDHYIRNTFAANLLCISFSHDENSALTKFLFKNIYGNTLAVYYLNEAFNNTKDLNNLNKLKKFVSMQKQPQKLPEQPIQ
jgi:hypothetical protein